MSKTGNQQSNIDEKILKSVKKHAEFFADLAV